MTSKAGTEGVHHRDVVSVALEHLAEGLAGDERALLLAKFGARETAPNGDTARVGPAQNMSGENPTPRLADSPRPAP